MSANGTTTGATYGFSLGEPLEADRVGHKAANLSRMMALDLPVPGGFVLSDDALGLFLDEAGLRAPVSAIVGCLRIGDPTGLEAASLEIGDMLLAAGMPEPLPRELEKRCREMGGGSLAVRSSAIGEDSPDASYAGQLDTYLDVMPGVDLEEAVVRCWASLWSVRALTYGLARGRPCSGMGVIVQDLVPAEFSGVLFTVSPVPAGKGSGMLGEYCPGTGVALVSGSENPGRFTIGRPDHEVTCTAPLGLPGEERLFRHLSSAGIGSIGLRLEQEFGLPQDIEWSTDAEGRLFLLQSRPITTLGPDSNARVPEECEGRRPMSWSNANVNENFPGPISPFLYSIASTGYYFYFRNLARSFGISPERIREMDYPMRQIIGVHGARMYYNLTHIRQVLRLAPGGAWLGEFFDRFVGADSSRETPEADDPAEGCGSRFAVVRCLLSVVRQYLFLGRKIERFERLTDAFAVRTTPEALGDRSVLGLRDDLREFLRIRCHGWNDAALADAAAMVSFGVLNRLLLRVVPDEDPSVVGHSLLEGMPGVVSVGSVVELWDLAVRIREDPRLEALFETSDTGAVLERVRAGSQFPEFGRAFERYLDAWGFRCSGELMLTVPSFQERPEPLIDILRSYLRVDAASPQDLIEASRRRSRSETRRVLKRLGRRRTAGFVVKILDRLLFRVVIRATHAAIRFRERARLKQALVYSRLRQVLLVLGDQLVRTGEIADRDDVFFLTHEELDDLLSGRAMFPGSTDDLVALRRRAHRRLEDTKPPPSFQLQEGAYLPMGASGEPPPESARSDLSGISACGGRARGRARVLDDVTEAHLLGPDEILVTEQTDPGWGPAFFIAKGLVMERGGMLSHGAILAREFGIPAVVGVDGAKRRIPTGSRIVVDGSGGRVEILD